MDATFASYQARLDSFAGPKTKSRRTSTRSKKPGPKAAQKGGWPLSFPRPEDLAFAGFVFKPTSTSPDNAQCFSCQTQLDGWEENDVPAHEHLTHSPNCGFAMNVCIRLRNGDPGRTEDDPLSDTMLESRRRTFADLWPLDVEAGFPSVEQMVTAGWYYDPSLDNPDGVTCAYCGLSLDAWDAGDDPTEEHQKRSSDCLFFSLKDFYHPVQKPKAARGKRSSSRSSTASRKTTKTTRTKKGASREDLNKPLPPPPDETTMESFVESFADSMVSGPVKGPGKGRKPRKAPAQDESQMESFAESYAFSVTSVPAKAPAKGRKAKNAQMSGEAPKEQFAESFADTTGLSGPPTTTTTTTTKGRKTKAAAKRVSAVSTASTTRGTRRNKRTSDALDLEDEPVLSPKRPKISDISSHMVLESTPVKTPQAFQQPAASKSSPLIAQPRTPEFTPAAKTAIWEPVNIDDFFEGREMFGIVSNVIVDSGLDKENIDIDMKDTPESLARAVKMGLTSPEKKMSIEEWVVYNAKRGEEKLRTECERQIAAFEAASRRALAALDAY